MSLSQEIESRIAILDVVNRYIQTKKAGVNYKALCPFHNEKTPSFVISPAKNIAKCFSCGVGGGPIKFLMEIEKIEFREAAAILAKEAGIELKTNFSAQTTEKWKDVYLLYRLATDWYHQNLFSESGNEALLYLQNRGISRETIEKFALGFSSNSRDLIQFLKSQWFEEKFVIESGLFVSPTRDKFFGRVIFPIANTMGNTVAFTGRILQNGEPKYLNSPASRIFDKSSILYGLHLAKQTIARTTEVFIVEGQMDTISLHQAGVTNAVGISGTALTQDHIRILKRFAKIIYLALDADSAGVKATFLSIENLLNSDLEIRVILIPEGKDPDEFIKSGGDFEALKNTSLSVVDYFIKMGGQEYNLNTLVGQKQLIEKCLELVAHISSPIEVDFYIKQLAEAFDISRDALYETFSHKKRVVQSKQNQPTQKIQKFSPNIFSLLGAFITKFALFDLFFEKFAYTVEDIFSLPDAWLLYRIVSKTDLDESDIEELSTIEVYIDENYPDQHPDIVSRQFFDLLKQLHAELLEQEKNKMLEKISPDSAEYLQAYAYLVNKGRQLGIQPGKFNF